MRLTSRRAVQQRALADLAVLRVRRLLRRGPPYSFTPTRARLCGAALHTYNLDTLAYLVREVFVAGCYEVGELPQRPVIFDVGANIGLASLYFRLRYPTSVITAVEADPDNFALLKENITSAMDNQVKALHRAAGEIAGQVPLYRYPGKPGRLTTSVERDRGGAEEVVVPAFRLSSIVTGPVDLLKLDIEGAEHQVLRDLADADVLRWIRRVVFELHLRNAGQAAADRTLDLLRRHRFRCRVVGDDAEGDWARAGETVIVHAEQSPARC